MECKSRLNEYFNTIRQLKQIRETFNFNFDIKNESKSEGVLSYSQERIWLYDKLNLNRQAYNIGISFLIKGNLDLNILKSALLFLVKRHPILTSKFYEIDGVPYQQEGFYSFESTFTECFGIGNSCREIQDFIDKVANTELNLFEDSPFKLYFSQISDDSFLLFFKLHHIIADGVSINILLHEVSQIYNSYKRDIKISLPTLENTFCKFAKWQKLESTKNIFHRIYSEYLNKITLNDYDILKLDSLKSRPPILNYKGNRHKFKLSSETRTKLLQISNELGVSLYVLILTIFKIIIFRYTRSHQILLGSMVSSRPFLWVQNLIGCFSNLIIIRSELSGQMTYRDAIDKIYLSYLEAIKYQDLPFQEIINSCKFARDASVSSIVQIMFLFNTIDRKSFDLESLSIEQIKPKKNTSKFELTLSVTDDKEFLEFEFEYNTDIYSPEYIRNFESHIHNITKDLIQNVDNCISSADYRSDQDLSIYSTLNSPRFEYPNSSIVELFLKQLKANPERTAFIIDSGGKISFHELAILFHKIREILIDSSLEDKEVLAISMKRSPLYVATLLAISSLNCIYLPIDEANPQKRIEYILKDSQVKKILSDWNMPNYQEIKTINILESLDSKSFEANNIMPDNFEFPIDLDSPAYVLYTSGSSGHPKGVLGTHRGIVNRMHWMYEKYPFYSSDIACHKTSIGFVDSIWEVFGPLCAGIPSVIVSESNMLNLEQFLTILNNFKVTRIVLVPTLLSAILDYTLNVREIIPKLNFWISSGEYLAYELVCKFKRALPNAKLLNIYGSTEVAADALYFDTDEIIKDNGIPIGKPLYNFQAQVLDQSLMSVPCGVCGELFITGDGLAKGYFGSASNDSSKFPIIFSKDKKQRFYKTGDIVVLDFNGDIHYLGRRDRQIKLRGYRIELDEIETVLNQYSFIRKSAVLLKRSFGANKTDILAAIIVPHQSLLISKSKIFEYLESCIPAYMIPSIIKFTDKIDLLPNGKIDYMKISNLISVNNLDSKPRVLDSVILQCINKIWMEVFKQKNIDNNSNFFELGGTSLQAARIMAMLSKELNEEIPLGCFLRYQTPFELADYLESKRSSRI